MARAARPRRAPARRASSRPTAARSCRSRRTTTSASPSTPRSIAAAHDALDRWGTGVGVGAPHRRLAARCTASSRPSSPTWKGTEARGAVPHRLRRQPRRAHHVRRARRARVLRRAEPRVDHRRLPARAARRRGLPPPRRRARRRAAARRPSAARAIVVTDTVFSMDGDVAPVDELARACARATARCSCSTRRTPCSARPRGPDDVDVLRVGTLSKTLGALGGFVAGPAPLHRPAREPRPAVHLHHRVDARPTPPPRSPRSRVRALARGRRAAGPAARQRRPRCGPGTRRRSCRIVCGDEARALAAAAALLDAGLLVPAIRPPTVPPGTSRLRVALSAAHTDEQVDALAAALRRAASPAHERRPDRARWCSSPAPAPRSARPGGRPRSPGELRTGGVPVAARKPVQSFDPGDADRRRACSPPPPARTPTTVCPPHRTLRHRVGAADGRRRAGRSRRSRSPTSPASIDVARRRSTSVSSKGVGGPRSPLGDDGDNVDLARAARAPTSSCSSPTPGSARSTRCGCRRPRSPTSRWSSRSTATATDPLHARNREHLVERRRLRRGDRRRAQLADRRACDGR